MLYVYGQNDPWGGERFRVDKGAKDSYVLTAPGMNHGANVAGLVADQKAFATARILDWAACRPPRSPRRSRSRRSTRSWTYGTWSASPHCVRDTAADSGARRAPESAGQYRFQLLDS